MTEPTPIRTRTRPLPSPLAGMSTGTFLREYWQKKPLLIRAAMPVTSLADLMTTRELFALAADPDVESRLVRSDPWRLRQGPIARPPPRRQPGWSLLVQGVDLHVPAARHLLDHFRFIPDARLDDLMISHASDQGGIGPHIDSYDVFLLQSRGQRRWRIAPPGISQGNGGPDPDAWIPDLPLKILASFEPTEDWLLEPGDMLYLPPGWAHEGTAVGECMTCSIGFRAPSPDELQRAFFAALADEPGPAGQASRLRESRRYRDRSPRPTERPAEIPDDMARTLTDWLTRYRPDQATIDRFIGRHLSEPKSNVWFDAPDSPPSLLDTASRHGVVLDLGTRMLYRGNLVFINGESLQPPRAALALLRQLADQRMLDQPQTQRAVRNEWLCATLDDWLAAGWIRDADF